MLTKIKKIETIKELVKHFRSYDVVCLYPMKWQDFCQYFQKQIPSQILPTPLILSGWGSNDFKKRERFEEHLAIINKHLGIRTLARYFSYFVKEQDFYKAENINPNEKSYWEEIADDFNQAQKYYFMGSKVLKEIIKFQPNLIYYEDLFQFVFPYQEKIRKGSSRKPKVRLVYDKSELVRLIIKFYEIFELQENNFDASWDLRDYCEHVADLLSDNMEWENDNLLLNRLLDEIKIKDSNILHQKLDIVEYDQKHYSRIFELKLFLISNDHETFSEIIGLSEKILLETYQFKVVWEKNNWLNFTNPSEELNVNLELLEQDTGSFINWEEDNIPSEVTANLCSYLDFINIGENLDQINDDFKDIKIDHYPLVLRLKIKKLLKKYLDYKINKNE